MISSFLCTTEQSRSLLEKDKADEAFNVTENKTNFITEIFFLKQYLDLGLPPPVITFNIDMLQQQKTVFTTLLIKIFMILLPMEAYC